MLELRSSNQSVVSSRCLMLVRTDEPSRVDRFTFVPEVDLVDAVQHVAGQSDFGRAELDSRASWSGVR